MIFGRAATRDGCVRDGQKLALFMKYSTTATSISSLVVWVVKVTGISNLTRQTPRYAQPGTDGTAIEATLNLKF
jgi:hypothetical protein